MVKDWKLKKLAELVEFYNGQAHENLVTDTGKYILINSKFISTDGRVAKHATKQLRPAVFGDVAIVMSDLPNGRALARTFFVDQNHLYTVNQRIGLLQSREEYLSEFMYYQLNRNKYYLSFDNGVSQTNLKREDILNCPILLPGKNEQLLISKALSDVDRLISNLSGLIKKKQSIKKGAMQDLITGKKRLKGFEKEWRILRLEKILRIRNGRNQKYIEIKEGKYPILATGGEIGRTNTPIYDKESVLIGRKGTIDRPQYMDTPFWTVDTLFYSELFDEMDGKFIYYLFQMIPWRSLNASTGVPSLTSAIIHNIEVKIPELDEQKAIATILSDMDEEIFKLEKKLEKYKKIKQGMMEQLLTGKIRLA